MIRHTVKAKVLELAMRIVKKGAARIFINPTGFHTDKAVLTDIDDTDAVARADFVKLGQELDSLKLLAIDRNRFAFFKAYRNILRFIGSILRCLRNQEHAVLRLICRILEIGTFV